jgi:hypothetical protein
MDIKAKKLKKLLISWQIYVKIELAFKKEVLEWKI